MDARSPLRAFLCTAVLAVGLVACTAGSSPPASVVPTPSVQPSAPSPSGSAVASATPSPSPSSCPIATLDLTLSSDRMVGVEVDPGTTEDAVRFRLGAPSSDPGTGETVPTVRIEAASPPYVSDPAGLPLDVPGALVAVVRMQAMWLYDEAGTSTYVGPARFDEPGPGIRSVVRVGAFEGYETWLVGFDSGCLGAALAPDGSLEVRVAR